MVFKEAFEHYRAGTATPEETTYIEQELEKNRLISEYLENDFDVNMEHDEAPVEELKIVKKSIRRRNRNIIAVSVAIVAILALLAFFVARPLLNNLYYNPMTKNYEKYAYDFDLSMVAYTELHQAYYVYDSTIIENTGIGKYTMTMFRSNISTGKQEVLSASLNKNKLTLPYTLTTSNISVNIFSRASYPEYHLESATKESYIKALKEIPDYMRVKAAVSFSKDLSMDELIDLRGKTKVSFLWAGIRNAPEDKQRYPLCGMELTSSGIVYEEINSKYPAFDLSSIRGKMAYSASDYEAHFYSLLNYTIDHTEFLNAINPEQNAVSYYQDVLDYVKKDGVKTYGVMVVGSAADILAMMDTGIISQIWPLEAEVSF